MGIVDKMKVLVTGIICYMWLSSNVLGHNKGWSRLFEDEISEFHNEELTWENGGVGVPSWINGRYIKNGPARLNFPNQTRFYTNWMDGWGKLHSFTFKVLKYPSPENFWSHRYTRPHLPQEILCHLQLYQVS